MHLDSSELSILCIKHPEIGRPPSEWAVGAILHLLPAELRKLNDNRLGRISEPASAKIMADEAAKWENWLDLAIDIQRQQTAKARR